MTIDLVLAARRYLAEQEELTDLLGTGDGFDTWIFRGQDNTAMPLVRMEGTKRASLVLWRAPSLRAGTDHNNMKFLSLGVDIYVDPGRDSSANVIEPNLLPRFQPIEEVLDRLLHTPQGGELAWDSLRILGSRRRVDWSIGTLSDTDGTKISRAVFQVTTG